MCVCVCVGVCLVCDHRLTSQRVSLPGREGGEPVGGGGGGGASTL